MLEVTGLQFAYKHKKKNVLENINFTLSPGDCLCLLGPNGTGKSTLLRCILQFLKAQKGSIMINGIQLHSLTSAKRAKQLAYVSQASQMTFPYRVYEVIQMGRTPHLPAGASLRQKDMEIVQEAMKHLDIEWMENACFHELSGGEKQMVLIARALAQQANFLIMDEPTANLDYSNQIRILQMIKKLSQEGYGILMTSHFPDHGFLACNKALLMKDGLIMEQGNPEDVITSTSLTKLYDVPIIVAATEIQNQYVMEIKRVCIPILEKKELGEIKLKK
jgi:iron complex transport system ATP-binding protein